MKRKRQGGEVQGTILKETRVLSRPNMRFEVLLLALAVLEDAHVNIRRKSAKFIRFLHQNLRAKHEQKAALERGEQKEKQESHTRSSLGEALWPLLWFSSSCTCSALSSITSIALMNSLKWGAELVTEKS